MEILRKAYRIAKKNKGAPGIDSQTFADIESAGLDLFLTAIREELISGSYKPGRTVKSRSRKGKPVLFRFRASETGWSRGR